VENKVQQVLDDLLSEKRIPFALTVGKITKTPTEYTIHFHDSRIRTARIPIKRGEPFEAMVRSAVLARVRRISGPLRNWKDVD
jgi:hypothetical protein